MRGKTGVNAAFGHQLAVCSGLHHAPGVHHEYPARTAHRGEPVGDDDDGAFPGDTCERELHTRLAFGIERAGRLVEQQDGRFGDKRAGKRDALALAAGEIAPALARWRVPAAGKSFDEVTGCSVCRRLHLLVRRAGTAQRYVLANRRIEQEGVLRDDSQIAAERHSGDVAHVVAVDADIA